MGTIDWELLSRYAAGECAIDERAHVERLLAEDPELRIGLEAVRRVAAQHRDLTPRDELAERLRNLRARMPTGHPPRRRVPPLLRIAAAVLLVLGASVTGYLTTRAPSRAGIGVDPSSPSARTISTARGQRMSLRLSDGTRVVLGPASVLRYGATYGVRDRTLELTGEAAFTVVHDERRPFAVHTRGIVARDLGTRFVVRAYPDDSAADVVVAEGEVAVTRISSNTTGSVDSLLLTPGARGRATSDGRLVLTRDVPLDSYFGWTEGRLVFRRALLRDALPQLERWHDITVHVTEDELRDREFTATFGKGESASEMLQLIATVLQLDVVQATSRSYTLRAR